MHDGRAASAQLECGFWNVWQVGSTPCILLRAVVSPLLHQQQLGGTPSTYVACIVFSPGVLFWESVQVHALA
jgi:hypothetical protein